MFRTCIAARLLAAVALAVCLPLASAQDEAKTAPEDMGQYTGILLDARHLPDISRSPAPAIYGPAPEYVLAYPDRSQVPTPDEVQEQSIVRYYHTEEQAEKGVAGDRPLILRAEAVVGPAKDALRLTAEDLARLRELDKRIDFTRSWKVGFLVPANQ